ncbi:MAG: hypothetical protein EBY07_11150 [Actinobacteria bacterium]|jgi:hypothetical protein|nr:hypothetical protein [Actinomycetota bacterium]
MGKKAKEHRKKVQKRNQKIAEAKNQFQKMQKSFLEQMIANQELQGQNIGQEQIKPSVEVNPFEIQGPQI